MDKSVKRSVKTKPKTTVTRSKKTRKPEVSSWPLNGPTYRRPSSLTIASGGENPLPPLLSLAWVYENPGRATTAKPQGKSIHTLSLTVSPKAQDTLSRYVERYCRWGHTEDLLIDLGHVIVRVRRPVITAHGSGYLTFEWYE